MELHPSISNLIGPALSPLAAELDATPDQLIDWLSSPELTDRLAAIIANLESIEHLRALAARAPALATCRSLLTVDNPVEQRRVAATLLRTPIHAPRRQDARTPRPSKPYATQTSTPPSPGHTAIGQIPAKYTRMASEVELLRSLLPFVQSAPSNHASMAAPSPQDNRTSPRPSPFAAHASPPDAALDPALGRRSTAPPPAQNATVSAPQRPGLPVVPPLDLPVAPALHRRVPPTRAATLLAAAASSVRPAPRPP